MEHSRVHEWGALKFNTLELLQGSTLI